MSNEHVSAGFSTQIKSLLLNNTDNRAFSNIAKIYPFTTENISGYLDNLPVKDKSILTVAGSGDHILNLYFLEASHISAFDINLLSHYYTLFKTAAVRALNYHEFLSFFSKDTEDSFGYNMYLKIRKYLNGYACDFFDYAYDHFNNQGNILRSSGLFYQKPDVTHKITSYNFYPANEQNYELTKERIFDYAWYNCSITDLAEMLPSDKKFDLILLSNIMDYAVNIFGKNNYYEKYISKIIYPLMNKLKPDGYVKAHCIFGIESRDDLDVLLNKNLWKKALKNMNYKFNEYRYDSAINGMTDTSIVLKKI